MAGKSKKSDHTEAIGREIAAEIHKHTHINQHEAKAFFAGTLLDVCAVIRSLQSLNPLPHPIWGYRTENVESLTDLRKQVGRLQKMLRGMPDATRILLFADAEIDGTGDAPADKNTEKVLARLKHTVALLDTLKARCDNLIAAKPGKYGLVDFRQELVAQAALDLLRRHLVWPGTNDTGPFLKVSTLLYNAMTGKEPSTLSRACREAPKHNP